MNLIIKNSSKIPIYEQITTQIIDMIATGVLKSGDILPSMRGLAKSCKISVITAQRAYEELQVAGIIETVAGKGTYVAEVKTLKNDKKKQHGLDEQIMKVVSIAHEQNISFEELVCEIKKVYGREE